jgi:hypothetical protein
MIQRYKEVFSALRIAAAGKGMSKHNNMRNTGHFCANQVTQISN